MTRHLHAAIDHVGNPGDFLTFLLRHTPGSLCGVNVDRPNVSLSVTQGVLCTCWVRSGKVNAQG